MGSLHFLQKNAPQSMLWLMRRSAQSQAAFVARGSCGILRRVFCPCTGGLVPRALWLVRHWPRVSCPCAGGLVYAWGGNEYGQCGVHWGARDVVEPAPCVPSLRVVQVAAGGMHSCVLTTQGEVSTPGLLAHL